MGYPLPDFEDFGTGRFSTSDQIEFEKAERCILYGREADLKDVERACLVMLKFYFRRGVSLADRLSIEYPMFGALKGVVYRGGFRWNTVAGVVVRGVLWLANKKRPETAPGWNDYNFARWCVTGEQTAAASLYIWAASDCRGDSLIDSVASGEQVRRVVHAAWLIAQMRRRMGSFERVISSLERSGGARVGVHGVAAVVDWRLFGVDPAAGYSLFPAGAVRS